MSVPTRARRRVCSITVRVATAVVMVAVVSIVVPATRLVAAQPTTIEITGDDIREHLVALEAIAEDHGGDRAFGTAGYRASVDYVSGRLEAAGYEVSRVRVAVPDVPVRVRFGIGWRWATTTNVIAEWPGAADGGDVVVLGAHLDSVADGPGINDNGSGVAGILEVAEQIAESDATTQGSVRFAFWGAEEVGLVGSRAYVASLSSVERARIVAYLNADMIGSVNYVRGVYDPSVAVDSDDALPGAVPAPGSSAISERFYAYFASIDRPTVPIATDGESDDASFAAAGIPTGGVFTGASQDKTPAEADLFGGEAGRPTDPCYHRACDDLTNIDLEIAAQLAQSLTVVALDLAGVALPA